MTRHRRLWVVVAGLVLLWAVFRLSGLSASLNLQMVHDSFERHRLEGTLVFIALFAAGNLIHVPGWVFLAGAVAALGQFWGGLVTYLAAVVSCMLTFWVIRLVGADALRELEGRLAQRLFARLDGHPVQSVLVLRLLFQTAPALNYALAMSGVRLRGYLIGTVLGLPLPIAIYCVFFESLARWLGWPVQGLR
jgi:uncharacterized membrane protein YdjX (TVP38/TMEM64 family)